jgi:hypothetical protein
MKRLQVTRTLNADHVYAVLKQRGPCDQYSLAAYCVTDLPGLVKPHRAYANVGVALRLLRGWKVKRVGAKVRHPNGGLARTIWGAV